jgi:FMN reductase
MADVVLIGGSPSLVSRSTAVLAQVAQVLVVRGAAVQQIEVRALPAEDVLWAKSDSPALQAAVAAIQRASAVVIATPVYKAAYSGLLKAFLDLLPPGILARKIVLPIATGGSPGHLLAIDYAIKPVLSALGARYILNGVYVLDSQLQGSAAEGYTLGPAIRERLDAAVDELGSVLTNGIALAGPR